MSHRCILSSKHKKGIGLGCVQNRENLPSENWSHPWPIHRQETQSIIYRRQVKLFSYAGPCTLGPWETGSGIGKSLISTMATINANNRLTIDRWIIQAILIFESSNATVRFGPAIQLNAKRLHFTLWLWSQFANQFAYHALHRHLIKHKLSENSRLTGSCSSCTKNPWRYDDKNIGKCDICLQLGERF